MAASKCSTNLLTSSSLKHDRGIFSRSLRLPCARSKLVNNGGTKIQILFPSRAPVVDRDRCRTTVNSSSDGQIQQQSTVRPSSIPLDGRQSVVVPAVEKTSGIPNMFGTPEAGAPAPLGASLTDNGVNFAVFSSTAVSITLCLFTEEDLQAEKVSAEIPLHPVINCTGDVWHVHLPELDEGLLYAFRVQAPHVPAKGQWCDPQALVLDPYGITSISRGEYGKPGKDGDTWPQMASAVPLRDEFDWEGDRRLQHRPQDHIVYELHVRGFTQDPSSRVESPGTFAGMSEKLQHIADMGFTAVELMPVQEFNELEYYSPNPVTGEYRYNYWGYSTINFFSPASRYSSVGIADGGRGAITEFKELVKECHRNGLEVILDIVFNHTAEGNELGPVLSFRGLDNRVYYVVAPAGQFYNYSGCGNTFNCNHPVARRFIVDCLRYWVTEMHVDGFRFDLASIMTRASSTWEYEAMFGESSVHSEAGWEDAVVTGTPLGEPPLISMISNDGVLRGTRLVAEAWDAGGLYQVGKFPGGWAEWNGMFRDCVRNFIKGTDGMVGEFAERMCGSPNLYSESGRKPYHSVNFITVHDGFTLMDLVSYNEKHNLANAEDNMDGEEHNLSWNCGFGEKDEGDLAGVPVMELRQRQMRNLMVALMVAQGTPLVLMGDEYGHSKKGNNNTYCHDNQLNWMDWDQVARDEHGFVRFVKNLTALRREHPMLGIDFFPTGEHVQWHGVKSGEPDWSETSRLVAFTLVDPSTPTTEPLYIAFNASHKPSMMELPEYKGRCWRQVVDTAASSPGDILADDLTATELSAAEGQKRVLLQSDVYLMAPYSSIILRSESTEESELVQVEE